MELKCLKWLDDVQQAAELIAQVTHGLSEADYQEHPDLRTAAEQSRADGWPSFGV